MKIRCSICLALFKGRDDEDIYSTKCGHIFHHYCINPWIKRAGSSPDCRTSLITRKIFKLYLLSEEVTAGKGLKGEIRKLDEAVDELQEEFDELGNNFHRVTAQLANMKKKISSVRSKLKKGSYSV